MIWVRGQGQRPLPASVPRHWPDSITPPFSQMNIPLPSPKGAQCLTDVHTAPSLVGKIKSIVGRPV